MKLFFKGVELTISDRQALKRLEELEVGKDESVCEIVALVSYSNFSCKSVRPVFSALLAVGQPVTVRKESEMQKISSLTPGKKKLQGPRYAGGWRLMTSQSFQTFIECVRVLFE